MNMRKNKNKNKQTNKPKKKKKKKKTKRKTIKQTKIGWPWFDLLVLICYLSTNAENRSRSRVDHETVRMTLGCVLVKPS